MSGRRGRTITTRSMSKAESSSDSSRTTSSAAAASDTTTNNASQLVAFEKSQQELRQLFGAVNQRMAHLLNKNQGSLAKLKINLVACEEGKEDCEKNLACIDKEIESSNAQLEIIDQKRKELISCCSKSDLPPDQQVPDQLNELKQLELKGLEDMKSSLNDKKKEQEESREVIADLQKKYVKLIQDCQEQIRQLEDLIDVNDEMRDNYNQQILQLSIMNRRLYTISIQSPHN